MWDGTVVLCQNNLVYFNPLSLLLQYQTLIPSFSLAPSSFSFSHAIKLLSFSPITKPLSPSLTFFSDHHQAVVTKPCFSLRITKLLLNTNSPSPISKSVLPIHSSHKPDTLDTHLPFHSITLSSNRDSQGFSRVCGFGLRFCLQNLKRSSVGLSNQIKIKIKAIY